MDITRAGLAEITPEERLQRLEEMTEEVDVVISKLQQVPHGDLSFSHLPGAKWVREQLGHVADALSVAIAMSAQQQQQQQQEEEGQPKKQRREGEGEGEGHHHHHHHHHQQQQQLEGQGTGGYPPLQMHWAFDSEMAGGGPGEARSGWDAARAAGDAVIIIIIVTDLESHTRCASRAHVVRLYVP